MRGGCGFLRSLVVVTAANRAAATFAAGGEGTGYAKIQWRKPLDFRVSAYGGVSAVGFLDGE